MKEATNYIEFGSGGSTFLAIREDKIRYIVSVESAEKWINYLLEWRGIRKGVKDKKLEFLYVNVGEVGAWGMPIDDSYIDNYPQYSKLVFDNMEIKPDMIFIDGRFRVACAAATALAVDEKCKIFIHDYTSEEVYAVVENFLEKVDCCKTLAEFRVKKDIDNGIIENIYNQYCYVPLA